MRLKGNASEWFTRNIECPGRPIKDWSLEAVIEGLQKRFLNSLMHRQASNKFNTIKQGQKTVQELIQKLTKYAAQMVQYPDDYLFRRWLIATLRPSLQKEVLCRGITVEFSSMQDILEKVKDIEESSQYDIRSWMSVETMHSNTCANHAMARSSKQMVGTVLKGVGCIYAPDKVNPNIFQFYFDFSSIFHHTSMHPLLHDCYEFYLIFYYFISPFIIY